MTSSREGTSINKSHRTTASYGKRQEFGAISELLRRNFDVYLTLVDDQGIDCVIRQERDGCLRYLDIQIKARSREAKNPGMFVPLEVPHPRPNYWFIFYSEAVESYWIMSSLELVKEARRNREGKNAGRYSINFCNVNAHGKASSRPRFEHYRNGFDQLVWPDE